MVDAISTSTMDKVFGRQGGSLAKRHWIAMNAVMV